MPHIKAASEKTPRNKETPRIYENVINIEQLTIEVLRSETT